MAFKLCLNTSTIKTTPLLQKVHAAARHGFAGIELWINDIYEYIGRGGEVRDIELALKDTGLIVPCVIAMRAWGEAIDLEYPIMLDECKRRMELAARLRAPYIVATPPRLPCDLAQLTNRYGDLLRLGREAGIKPTFEYISFFKSAWKLNHAWQVVRDVNEPDATVIIDSFHNWNSGSTLDDLRAVPIERISHYHINDAHPAKPPLTQTDPDRVMLGEGQIDLKAEIQLLKEKGYHGTVSLELFNQDLWRKDPNEVLKTGIARMHELLD
ncbi:MAG: sugar phosphate isomerase/epimerase [Verrucomicrobiota bacterium]